MKPETKKKVSESMKEHLASIGWPSITNNQIIEQLPNLWKKLEEEGLTEDFEKVGFGYKYFVEAAIRKKNQQELLDKMFARFR